MILDRLPPIKSDSSMWVDEAIWGHRLYDEQTPWLCFLEFLNIGAYHFKHSKVFVEEKFNNLAYVPSRRLHLRNILFNNPFLPSILLSGQADEERWKNWNALMVKASGGLHEPDFSYLQKRFESFADFAELVKFLQSSSIEGDSNKRWSSKFVFPYGPDCLYEDLRVTNSEASNDRRFFARMGELLYLMISRCEQKELISGQLADLGLIGSTENTHARKNWNKLALLLQPEKENVGGQGSSAYLPHDKLEDYDLLAKDWLNIFDCQMPSYDVIPHLVTLTGLHMILYFLKRSAALLGLERPTFVLEMIAPRKNAVRELSAESFLKNDSLSEKATMRYAEEILDDPQWQAANSDGDPVGIARTLLEQKYLWKSDDESAPSPNKLMEDFKKRIQERHKQHVRKFHNSWSKEIGLSSTRGSRRTRYAPTDSLLKTLVFSTVSNRMEFQDFLELLYQKYGFIIGDKQAANFIGKGEADQITFSQNANRLEKRLGRLGLLKRLSDACAYVQNPYFGETDDARS